MDWMTQHFILRKLAGKHLLILDGHTSHTTCPNMLQIAADNNVIIHCLSSHYLQPLDQVLFKPFKTYFKDACGKLVTARCGTGKITRKEGFTFTFSMSRSATVHFATSAFCEIYPLDIDAIPEHAYLLSCDINNQQLDEGNREQLDTPSTHSATTTFCPSIPLTTSSEMFP